MYFILFLAYALQAVAKPITFYTITDNDGKTKYSYLTYNELVNNKEIRILKNVSVKPNELSSLKFINHSLYTTDDKTGLLYKITNYGIEVFDKCNNFYKSETAYMKGKHLYIYNYTKFRKGVTRQQDLRYNIVKYNMYNRKIDKVVDLTKTFNKYLKNNGYIAMDINAMDYDDKDGLLYLAPRFYRNKKEKKLYKSHFLVLSKGKIDKIRISKKLPELYGITDMDIFENRIYFVASRELKLEKVATTRGSNKDFRSIVFVTDMKGKLKTKFIPYDNYNKYEGITVKK